MRTIAIVNQKGGCGKTTTAINLAAILARRGLRTLLVDMDQQSHCAAGLGVPESRLDYSLADALVADPIEKADLANLIWEVGRNFDLAPSTMRMAGLEAPGGGLHRLPDKDRRLAQLLDRLAPRYDRCLIDCPPTVGLLTFNALRAAREVIIPVETGFFALRGAEKQWATIQRTIERLERPIACHILVTLYDPNSHVASEILATLRRKFAGQILPTVIHEHDSLREAASFGQPIIEYAPGSPAEHDFNQVADWLEQHEARPMVEIEVMPDAGSALVNRGVFDRSDEGCAGAGSRHDARDDDAEHASEIAAARREIRVSPVRPAAGPAEVEASGGGRAAELAARVRDLVHQRVAGRETIGAVLRPPQPESAAPASESLVLDVAGRPARSLDEHHDIGAALAFTEAPISAARAHTRAVIGGVRTQLFGVRQTSSGVLFVQPGNLGQRVFVAGQFNDWSATATPLQFDIALGVHHAVVAMSPGRYQYRLVVDGHWQADPNNDLCELNGHGEPNSVLVVASVAAEQRVRSEAAR